MPRQARLDAPGTLHHVMIRGIEGVEIFRDNEDRQDFISRISELVKKTGTKILNQGLGISMAEIGRQLGVCASAITKAIQNVEAEKQKY